MNEATRELFEHLRVDKIKKFISKFLLYQNSGYFKDLSNFEIKSSGIKNLMRIKKKFNDFNNLINYRKDCYDGDEQNFVDPYPGFINIYDDFVLFCSKFKIKYEADDRFWDYHDDRDRYRYRYCFSDWEDVAEFIDDDLLELRYMKKRFGYLFFDDFKYIKKINGRNAIFVNKEDQFVCRKPEEPTFHGIDENEPIFNIDGSINEKHYLNTTIPMEDTERYEIKFLDETDRGDPFITKDDKEQNEEVKQTKNILKKIKLVKPEIFNSDEFYEVLNSKEFDNIELEKDREKFYEQVREIVLCEKI